MKIFLVMLLFIVSVVSAIAVGNRVPPQTVAMAIGVVLGALASIPLSLVAGAMIGRSRSAGAGHEYATRQVFSTPAYAQSYAAQAYATQPPYPRYEGHSPVRDFPPVVIVNPAAYQSMRPEYQPAHVQQAAISGPREFRVIGEEATG
jgi:hypothetical protein